MEQHKELKVKREQLRPTTHVGRTRTQPLTWVHYLVIVLAIFDFAFKYALAANGPGVCPQDATGTNFTVGTQADIKNYVACSNDNPSTQYVLSITQNIVFDEWWQTASIDSGVWDNAALHILGTLHLVGIASSGSISISRSPTTSKFRLYV